MRRKWDASNFSSSLYNNELSVKWKYAVIKSERLCLGHQKEGVGGRAWEKTNRWRNWSFWPMVFIDYNSSPTAYLNASVYVFCLSSFSGLCQLPSLRGGTRLIHLVITRSTRAAASHFLKMDGFAQFFEVFTRFNHVTSAYICRAETIVLTEKHP